MLFAILTHPSSAAKFHTTRFDFEGRSVAYDSSETRDDQPIVILLHGASGPSLPIYQQQADFFASRGFNTILPHYFDATNSSQPTDQNYKAWVRLVETLINQLAAANKPRKIFLVGYSLGASVALAAGSQGVPVDAIAEWYGSLPDEFFYAFKTMPPLLILHGQRDDNIPVSNAAQLLKLCEMKRLVCDNHIYPDQGHGFSGQALTDADTRTVEFLSRHSQPD
jgi:dienelactone hydrolase